MCPCLCPPYLFCPTETKTSIEASDHLLRFIHQVLVPYQSVPGAIFLWVSLLHLSGGRIFARAMSPSIWVQSRPASSEPRSQRFTARDERTARGSRTRWTTLAKRPIGHFCPTSLPLSHSWQSKAPSPLSSPWLSWPPSTWRLGTCLVFSLWHKARCEAIAEQIFPREVPENNRRGHSRCRLLNSLLSERIYSCKGQGTHISNLIKSATKMAQKSRPKFCQKIWVLLSGKILSFHRPAKELLLGPSQILI